MYRRYKDNTLFTKLYTLPPCLTMFPVRVTLHSLIILNGVTTYAPRLIRLFYNTCAYRHTNAVTIYGLNYKSINQKLTITYIQDLIHCVYLSRPNYRHETVAACV